MESTLQALAVPHLDDSLEGVIGALPVAIAILRGPELVHELATPSYCRLVGRDDLQGCGNHEVRPQLIAKAADHVYRTGKALVDHELAIAFDRDGDGRLTRGYFDTAIRPLFDADGFISGVTVVAIEITSQVEGRMAAEAKRAEAERRSRSKDEFLAIASHELRNPLMAILGWTRFLRTEVTSRTQTERSLERIELNAMTQARLIDDLLDTSRITAGKLRLEPRELDFGELVQGVLESSRPAIEGKALRLALARDRELPMIMGDGARLQQVVWNLVTNAVKFTQRGGRIALSLQHDNGTLVLSVADDGDGISPTMLETIFERFTQGDPSSARSQRGLGLGLWIARDIVELHGGTLRALSDGLGRGATFVMRLPSAARPESPS